MKPPSRESFRFPIIVLLIGAVVSGVLVLQHYNQLREAGLLSMLCGPAAANGCEAVNRSEFSSLLGVPVAAIGFWFYLSLAMILGLASLADQPMKDLAGRLSFLSLCLALVADIVLLGIQLFSILSLCTLCISTYVVTVLTLYLLRTYGKKKIEGSAKAVRSTTVGKIFLASSLAGTVMLFVAVLAISKVLGYQDPDVYQERATEAAVEEFMKSPALDIILDGTPMQGAADAKIKVVIFSDFLCPWCRQVAQSFQQFMPKWNDRVAVYFKTYPLDAFCNPYVRPTTHPGACWAALGGICAQEQGKFWEYHDRMFTLPPKNPGSDDVLKIAHEAGIDSTVLSACMHEMSMQNKVRFEIRSAHAVGIDGTPRIYINGRKLPKLSYLTSILAFEAKRLGIPPLEGLNE